MPDPEQKLGREDPEISDDVRALVAEGKIRQAVKLHQEQAGVDMIDAMNAVGTLADEV